MKPFQFYKRNRSSSYPVTSLAPNTKSFAAVNLEVKLYSVGNMLH